MRFLVAFLKLFIFTFLIFEKTAHAYPQFISMGYTSCMNCHYNPYGNGPLTDYGRAVSATAISDRLIWASFVKEEDIANTSGFFFGPSPVPWLKPSLSFRRLVFRDNIGGAVPSQTRYITMDLGGSIVITPLKHDRLIFVGSMAYAPTAPGQSNNGSDYRSREHYVGYRYTKEIGVYAGMMDKVFGIRIPEHIAYSRTTTNLTQNDQSHSVLFHYLGKTFELGIQGFVGNLFQDYDLRQQGGTGTVEFTLAKDIRVGTSFLASASTYRGLNMYEAHTRMGFYEMISALLEVGIVNNTPFDTNVTTSSLYGMSQLYVKVRRGLYTSLQAEYLQADMSMTGDQWRFGPGIQWFPMQRVELRIDGYNTITNSASATQSNLRLLAQIHLWL